MKLFNKVFYAVGAVFVLGSTTLVADDMSPKEIVTKAQKYLASLDKYAFDAVIYDTYTEKGEEVFKSKHTVSAKLIRPDKLRVDVKGDTKDRSNYLSNGVYTMVDHSFGYYGQVKVPNNIDDALDFLIKEFGINAPLTSLLYQDMPKRTHFAKSKNFGVVDVFGVPCHYVAFRNHKKEVHIWIATGDKPLVRNYSVIDHSDAQHLRIDSSILWKDDASINSSDFVFTPSSGLTKISVERAN